ncbi:TPA: hypothetical protein ACX6RA_003543 [Photobacterium damselae]
MAQVKFLVTSESEAEYLLKQHFKQQPIAAGRDFAKSLRYWYCKGKQVCMKPTGTKTANGTVQYLVTVE